MTRRGHGAGCEIARCVVCKCNAHVLLYQTRSVIIVVRVEAKSQPMGVVYDDYCFNLGFCSIRNACYVDSLVSVRRNTMANDSTGNKGYWVFRLPFCGTAQFSEPIIDFESSCMCRGLGTLRNKGRRASRIGISNGTIDCRRNTRLQVTFSSRPAVNDGDKHNI